jgi:hypothetical protein
MQRSIRRAATLTVAAVTAIVATAVFGGSTPAHATARADDTALTRHQKQVTARIDLRLRALERLDALLDRKKHVTDAHRSTLGDLIDADVAGLTDLRTKVAGETTTEALKADAKSMINDYRIFILVRPKVRLTIVADNEAAAIDRLQKLHDKLADLVAKAKANGKQTDTAEAALTRMQASIDEAAKGLEGQVDALLALQPGPDGDAIRAEVAKIRQALGDVRTDLRAAVTAAKKVRDLTT